MILLISILAGVGLTVLVFAILWWVNLADEHIYDRMP